MTARLWNAAIAALVLGGLVVQLVIAVRLGGSPHDTTAGVVRGSSLAGRIVRILSFFTIQSNILCGIVAAQLARRPDRDGLVWRPVRLAALFGITVTGIVYSTVLARIHEPKGPAETFTNTVFHYVVPIAVVLGWLLFGPRPRMDRAAIAWSLVYPVAWTAYTLVRGAIWKWYPYGFIDVVTHGYARVALNALLVVLVLAAVAAVFAVADRRLPTTASQRRRSTQQHRSERQRPSEQRPG